MRIRKTFLTIFRDFGKKNAVLTMRCNCLMHTKFSARLTPFAGLIFAFSALSAAEYGYVGTETYYSLDDPQS